MDAKLAPSVTPPAAWRELLDAAADRYRASGRFAYHFARGKLGRDPVFRYLVEKGLFLPPNQEGPVRLLDLGSGQSLVASLVHEAARLHAAGRWPRGWAEPPQEALMYTGIELMPKDVERARSGLSGLPSKPRVVLGNLCEAPFPPSDIVLILDVLHYLDYPAQDHVLARVRASLRTGGLLLLRVGDQASPRGFVASQWVDRAVTLLRGHRAPPTWGRDLPQWIEALEAKGFAVRAVPKSEGTPFANVLLVATNG